MTRRKLTPAQRRVLRRMVNIERRPFRPRFRSDLQIARKLRLRGYVVMGVREVSQEQWLLSNWLTSKGRAALDDTGSRTRE